MSDHRSHKHPSALIQKIRHGLHRRWKKVSYDFRTLLALFSLKAGQYLPMSKKRHNLNGELIVSLTSHPPRFSTLTFTLRSLLQQTMKADRMILWIAHDDMQKLPDDVIELKSLGLEIRAADDLKSYKKIIPALKAFPEAFVCTADDDVYYWPNWLEELVAGLDPDNKTVTCQRAHGMVMNTDGSFKPYMEWRQDILERTMSLDVFPTGVGGILYPPGALTHTPTDRDIINSHCPNGDDLWLYWIGRRNGMRYKTVGKHRNLLNWAGTQETALWQDNVGQGNNDKQIQKLSAHYGFPDAQTWQKMSAGQ